jgi:hypothetical protein
MNPYIFDPRKVTTPQQATIIEGYFDKEIANQTEVIKQAEETLGAIMDVVSQTHPDLIETFNQLVYAGNLVGHGEQSKQDTVLMKSQFHSALPYSVKTQLT